MTPLKWDKPWGPPRLRALILMLIDEINHRTPVEGLGIDIDDTPLGQQISDKLKPRTEEEEKEGMIGALGGSAGDPDISFFLSDASTTEGDVTSNKVKVADGLINDVFPAGMGGDDFILDLDDPSNAIIYAGATFDPGSFEITSRFLGVSSAGAFPESRVETAEEGFLYWRLGYTYFDGDGDFRIINSRAGDINFSFSYGSYNAQPALWVEGIGWLDLSALFP